MIDNRFNLSNLIVDKDKSFIQANINKLKGVSNGVYIVPPMHTHRLDLISYKIYGTVAMKPYLIYVNDIVDVSVIKHGYKLKYPSLRDILSLINEVSEQL